MSDRRPNFLFFLPDQHRADWLGTNPALPLRTPNLDALGARGVRFVQAFCTSPLCAPARASLASGRDYDRCGVPNNRYDYPLEQPTYYQALRAAGYRVAGVGKFDLHKATLDWGLDGSRLLSEWGFTEGIDSEGKLDGTTSYRRNGNRPRGPYLAFLQERGLAGQYLREHEGDFLRAHGGAYTTCLPEDAYGDNWVAENGLRLLRQFPAGQPWHLVVNFPGPHNPFDVTPAMRARWEDVEIPPPHANPQGNEPAVRRARQNYAAIIENLDRQVGRFLEAVAERGELDNTLVVYASDHGEMLGDHGLWGKSTWCTPSVGVPLLVAGPGVVSGRVSSALVSLHDLAATFLDYAGAPPLPGMDVLSLRELLGGRVAAHRPYVVCGLDQWRLIYDGRYKLVLRAEGAPLLFDLQQDPAEDINLADRPEYCEVGERLRKALEQETGGVARLSA